jgi:two-component system sensor histidine kinase AlgZ
VTLSGKTEREKPTKMKSADMAVSRRDFFLPDLCRGQGLGAVLIISELLALLITIAESGLQHFDWLKLSKVSLLSLWIALLSAIVLCLCNRRLSRLSHVSATFIAFFLILLVTLFCGAISEGVIWWFSSPLMSREYNAGNIFEYLIMVAIPAGILLYYLYLQQQLRIQERVELEARIQALQSRIRPHFLFNCMNMIASLIGSDPEKAERVVEDMSDLFRYALSDTRTLVPLSEELSLCRRYMALEKLRLGDRLSTRWEIGDYGRGVEIPSLMLQPVLENAVYHGVQLLREGGEIFVSISRTDDVIEILVSNPLGQAGQHHKGNQMALQNISQRLNAHFGAGALATAEIKENCYITRIHYSVDYGEANK